MQQRRYIRPHSLYMHVQQSWEGRSSPLRLVDVKCAQTSVENRSVCPRVCTSAVQLHTCVSICRPATAKQRKTEKDCSLWLDWLPSFFLCLSSFPRPFHSATSAETSFHSSCCSQLINLHTLLFFTREGGRESE